MKLTRSRTNRMLAGVIGGLSETFGINATLLRILFVVLLFSTGVFPIAILYGIMVFFLSNKDGN